MSVPPKRRAAPSEDVAPTTTITLAKPTPGDDTPERILHAALELFYEVGYHGASIRPLAAAAGTQINTVYYHFGNKQGILFALMERTIRRLTDHILEQTSRGRDPIERLVLAFSAHVEWHATCQKEAFIADCELPRLEGEFRDAIVELRDAHEAIFREILNEGVQNGVLADMDVGLTTRILMSSGTGVAWWYREGGAHRPAEIAAAYCKRLLEGMLPRA